MTRRRLLSGGRLSSMGSRWSVGYLDEMVARARSLMRCMGSVRWVPGTSRALRIGVSVVQQADLAMDASGITAQVAECCSVCVLSDGSLESAKHCESAYLSGASSNISLRIHQVLPRRSRIDAMHGFCVPDHCDISRIVISRWSDRPGGRLVRQVALHSSAK
jgi:hypothetical protein